MILSILVGSHLGNIPMKLESHWPKGLVGVSFLNKLLTTDDIGQTLIIIAKKRGHCGKSDGLVIWRSKINFPSVYIIIDHVLTVNKQY